MPFTISHVVAILPLTTGRPGRFLVPGALAIGSMVPDLPYFVPPHLGASSSHSALGPVTTDLILGVLVYALWHFLLVLPLTDLAPRWLRARLPKRRGMTAGRWLAVAASVVIGSATHVLWDSLTHANRWGTRHVGWLNAYAGDLPLFKWFQYGSGVVGLVILTFWFLGFVYRTSPDQSAVGVADSRTRLVCWAVTTAVAVGSAGGTWLVGSAGGDDWFQEAVAVRMATRTITLTAATVLALCVAWRARHTLSPDSRLAAWLDP